MNQGLSPLPPPPPPKNLEKKKGKAPANIQDPRAIDAKKKTSRPKPSPGQPTLEYIIKNAYESGFSDIHLGVGVVPRMRDRGEMALTDYPKTDHNTFMSWLHEILSEQDIQKFLTELEFDGATQYDFARVRINVFDTLTGPALVMRLIPLKILTMDQLGLPPVFRARC